MRKVKSSHLDWIKYDKDSKTLEICFHNGETYHYFNVSDEVYENFDKAKSHGSYFAKNIKSAFKSKKKEPENK